MTTFGTHLRQKRQERGISLEDISASTRVSVRYFRALEEDDFTALPGGVFNRGIVRGYARCLEMDEQDTVEAFMEACRSRGIQDGGDQAWTEFAQNVSNQRGGKSGRRWRWLGVFGLFLLVLLAGFGTYRYVKHRAASSTGEPQVTPQNQ